MSIGSNIYLELYWQGDYTYKDWDISAIDIKMEESTHEISAHINTALSSTHEQRLSFKARKKRGYFLESDEVCQNIECPTDLIKSMKVSAKIFQIYENRSMLIRQLDGSYSFDTLARTDECSIFIDKFPELQPNETYQIKIVNQDNNLRATFEKKVSEVAIQKMQEVKKDQVGTAEAAILDLQGQLKIANQNLITAKASLDRACNSGNQLLMMGELARKQAIIKEILYLQRALAAKGISQNDFFAQAI